MLENGCLLISLVPHICVRESGQHWFRWIVAYSPPSHQLNQCCVIVNWTLRNKLQWNFNQNTKLLIYENASENIVCEMAAILSSERWVNREQYQQHRPLLMPNEQAVIIYSQVKHRLLSCCFDIFVYVLDDQKGKRDVEWMIQNKCTRVSHNLGYHLVCTWGQK